MHISIDRAARWIAVAVTCLCFAGCNTDRVLKVEFPGQIPTDQINDPTLAPVLVRSVIGDLECAYSNYMSGPSVHSDASETANPNVPLGKWGQRTITADDDDSSETTCHAPVS